MEIGVLPLGVHKFNIRRFEIGLERVHIGHDFREYGTIGAGMAFGLEFAQFVHHIGMKTDDGLLVILGRGSAGADEGLGGIQMNVVPFHCGKFAATKPGENGGDVNRTAFLRDSQKAFKFCVGEGATGAALLPVDLHLLDMPKGVFVNAVMLLHPVEKRTDGNQIFVDGLGRKRLLRPPCLERIGGNIFDLAPAAFAHEAADAIFQLVDVLAVPFDGLEVGHVIGKMRCQRSL